MNIRPSAPGDNGVCYNPYASSLGQEVVRGVIRQDRSNEQPSNGGIKKLSNGAISLGHEVYLCTSCSTASVGVLDPSALRDSGELFLYFIPQMLILHQNIDCRI